MIDVVIITKESDTNLGFLHQSIAAVNEQGVEYNGFLVPSAEGVCAEFGREQGWTVLPLPDPERNLVRAINHGVNAGSADRILYLSDSSYLHDGALRAMLAHPDPLIGCVQYQHGVLNHHGGTFARGNIPVHLQRGAPRPTECLPVEWFTGAVMVADRELWGRLGGFDEKFAWLLGDVDLCLRARELGVVPIVCADASADHIEHQTRPLHMTDEMSVHWNAKWSPARLAAVPHLTKMANSATTL